MLYRVMNAVERANGVVYSALPSSRSQQRKTEDHQASYHDKIERQMRHLVAVTQARKADGSKAKAPLKKNGLTNHHHLVKSVGMKTPATPTTQQGETILTPRMIQHHCSTILKSTSLQLSKEQELVEGRLNKSLRRLRRRQFSLNHSHAKNQVETRSANSSHRDELPCKISRPSSLENLAMKSLSDSTTSLAPSFLTEGPSLHSKEPLSDYKVSYSLQQQLQALGSFVDDEATCSSSDEEEDVKQEKSKNDRWARRQVAKHAWEQDRAKIGSKWAWLCHQVTSVSQKLYQLDTVFQSNPFKEPVQFSSHNPFGVPCICGGRTESAKVGGPNGSIKTERINGTTPSSNSPCGCQVRQMLMSNPSMLAQQVQVRDVLGYSFPVLFMDETTQTCARTRELNHAPRRKLIRKTRHPPNRGSSLGNGYHQYLSQPSDIPCNAWLDTTLHQVLQEHSYASIPLYKRRRVANLDTTSLLPAMSLDRSKSFSPSPAPTLLDTPIDRYKAGPRKRNSNTSSMSEDTPNSATPLSIFKKRKGVATPQYDIDNIIIHSIASGTRLEKIEYKEIVTPKWREVGKTDEAPPLTNGVDVIKSSKDFRMVAVNDTVDDDDIDPRQLEDDMDLSDETFAQRHSKWEENERKRHVCYVSGVGSHRKRPRLQPQASTPDSSHLPSAEHEEWVQQVQPFVPRTFPLTGKDLEDLINPGPPPERVVHLVPVYDPSSPRLLVTTPPHSSIVRTPLDSMAATPLSSPCSMTTPPKEGSLEECPLSSSSTQWSVVSATKDPTQQLTVVLKLNKTN